MFWRIKTTVPFVFYRSRCMKIGTHSSATALPQAAVQMTRTVHLHRHDVYCPIIHCPINAQIGPAMTNQIREFCYSFD